MKYLISLLFLIFSNMSSAGSGGGNGQNNNIDFCDDKLADYIYQGNLSLPVTIKIDELYEISQMPIELEAAEEIEVISEISNSCFIISVK